MSCLRIRSMKKFQQFSRVSSKPSALNSTRIEVMIISTSSSLKRSGISPTNTHWELLSGFKGRRKCERSLQCLPDASMSLIRTRNLSSGIWASVCRKTVPMFFTPTFMYNAAISLYKERNKDKSRTTFHNLIKLQTKRDNWKAVWVCYPQVADAITLPQCDLKYFQDAEKSSQPTETLFPTPTDSNQQGIPHRRLKNTTYPTTAHKHTHITLTD